MTDLHGANSVHAEGDSWEITESVGATALSVAAARAVATGASDPLIRDPFANLLVSSAGPAWERMASPGLEWIGDDEHWRRAHQLVCDYQAVRTHFFDE
jgi:O-methyltransferase involved in polyketide biosynthesis